MDDVTEIQSSGPQTPVVEIPPALQMELEVERLFRESEPAAFFVQPRVVRRVLQNELDITSPWLAMCERLLAGGGCSTRFLERERTAAS